MDEVDCVPRWMYVGAFRYYVGRMTAARGYMADWLIEHADELPQWLREKMVEEIHENRDLGMECDMAAWKNVIERFEKVDER